MNEAPAPPIPCKIRDYRTLPGWQEDDHAAAFRVFRQGAAVLPEHPPKARAFGIDPAALSAILARAIAAPADLEGARARAFFEAEFMPMEVLPGRDAGFFTGYYEPIVSGSRKKRARFGTPLYRVPDDLIEFDQASPPAGIDPEQRFARTTDAGLVPYYDRAEIEAGALAGRGLELVFLADPVEAFFVHIQGAARIKLAEGGSMRVAYAAKSGHAYTPIGRVLIEMGKLKKGSATMAAIRDWLAANPERAPAVMAQNRSFIFFREAPVAEPGLGPIGAAKVPLTAGRSLAVDRLVHAFHGPVWIETALPDGQPFHRLTIAQDTGSAIVGPARGDIFFGSGVAAGEIAGAMAAEGRFVVLVPRGTRR